MNVNVECPNCGSEVPVAQVLHSQVETKVRQEIQASIAAERSDLQKQRAALEQAQQELKLTDEQVQQRVQKTLAEERAALSAKLLEQARNSIRLELADRDDQLVQLRKDLETTQAAELEIRKRERDLQEKTQRLEIEVERKIDEERKKIQLEAAKNADDRYELKVAEKEKTIDDMRKQIEALRRKSEQTSQQLQGEVQELALEERLRAAFPVDTIDPVGKGRNGADVGQLVSDPTGNPAGRIVWESKRTKNWSDDWLGKIRDDLREADADIAVIVSEALPNGVSTISCIDGVWVCSWNCLLGLATALRSGLIDVAAAGRASEGKGTKVEILYDYFAGNSFRNRISGVVEAIQALQQDLAKEKAAMQRIWAKREKQHARTIQNISGLYGDFQGIIGSAVPALESIELLKLESIDSDAD